MRFVRRSVMRLLRLALLLCSATALDANAQTPEATWSYGPLAGFDFESDGAIIGVGGLEVHGSHALLRSLAGSPAYQGRGLATAICDHLEAEELLSMVQELPVGYRIVFNLYAIDGYSHKEIAEQLGISENTSKSQLSRARVYLQKLLAERQWISKRQINAHEPTN